MIDFYSRVSIEQVEEGCEFAPKFNSEGLLPVITVDGNKTVLMLGYMNKEALELTLRHGTVHYYSRSRRVVWLKGEVSGLHQWVRSIRVDDDQDALWVTVKVSGNQASCHVGYYSCFYRELAWPWPNSEDVIRSDQDNQSAVAPRSLDLASSAGANEGAKLRLRFIESAKVFDPELVYEGMENPTKI